WLWRAHETLRPWLDAGCRALAFDHVGVHGLPASAAWQLLRLLRSLGCKVYGEPHGPGSFDLDGCIAQDEVWHKAHALHEWRGKQKGEIIRFVSSEDDAEMARVIADGHT